MSIRVISIGVGGFGESWRHTLKTTPEVEVVALVDIDKVALSDAAAFFNIPKECCIDDPKKPWEEIEADVLLDATPQCNRLNHALRAFRGGKHLIVVKPMSDKWDSALTMVKEAEKSGLKIVVAQQMRFHPVILKLRELVQSNTLGEIGYVNLDAHFSLTGMGGSYPQLYPLLVQGSIHHFDFLRWVLGEDAVSVWCDTWNPPWITGEGMRCAYVTFKMESGCRTNYRAIATATGQRSWLCDWRIEGTKGIATVSDDRVYLNNSKVDLAWDDGSDLSNLKLPELNKIVFQQFIEYTSKDKEPGVSGRNNLKSMEMVFGAIESSETGRRYDMGN
ncbi:Gfo/Idh/MocA family oxidoreductase [bacterium]|nr:Gfo/Idh/MocA family oxidoreductase [bacterium]